MRQQAGEMQRQLGGGLACSGGGGEGGSGADGRARSSVVWRGGGGGGGGLSGIDDGSDGRGLLARGAVHLTGVVDASAGRTRASGTAGECDAMCGRWAGGCDVKARRHGAFGAGRGEEGEKGRIICENEAACVCRARTYARA